MSKLLGGVSGVALGTQLKREVERVLLLVRLVQHFIVADDRVSAVPNVGYFELKLVQPHQHQRAAAKDVVCEVCCQ